MRRPARDWLHLAILLAATYALAETVVTLRYLMASSGPDWYALFEDSGKTVQFDPVRGYRYTTTPSRFARVSYGKLEFVGTLRGNSEGFPDRDDFGSVRGDEKARRIAVLGDSFSAALYLERNWPDRVEDLARRQGKALELLNFSTDGGGLANWWSNLTLLVRAERYEIDGLLFAVWPGDLQRRFVMYEQRGTEFPLFGHAPAWDPATYPSSLEEARSLLRPLPNAFIVSEETFGRALRGEWHPPTPFRLDLAYRMRWAAHRLRKAVLPDRELRSLGDDPEQARLIEDIRQFAFDAGLPVTVVHVPDRSELLDDDIPAEPPPDVREFSRILGARLLNGAQAFEGAGRDEILSSWHEFDGHWNQQGSDRFADYVLPHLLR